MTVRFGTCVALVGVGLLALSLQAVTWTRENSVTPGTVALYHFNEASGTAASNAAGPARWLTLEDAHVRFRESNTWRPGLVRALAMTGLVAATLCCDVTTDWQTTDLTLSCWLRAPAALVPHTNVPAMPEAPWGARCGAAWLPDPHAPLAVRVRNLLIALASVGSNTLCDGAWHHVAWAYQAASQSAAVFFDNVLHTNVLVAAGETTSMLNTLVVGDGLAGPALGSVHLDELFITTDSITDFSDGFVPEPAGVVLACLLITCLRPEAARAHHII